MSAAKVGAGDTAEKRVEGLVRCSECERHRNVGVDRFYCPVFWLVVPFDEARLCTAFRPLARS